ncbi:hypothetical protein MNB_SV-4-45 [hydrothermal vent metagenome]|uniref:Uncharacterized protein n=1 Tax=hydrothermal vent metagenome TaxID=652676 RepID=A0A1W1EAB8_9ZZZZ
MPFMHTIKHIIATIFSVALIVAGTFNLFLFFKYTQKKRYTLIAFY